MTRTHRLLTLLALIFAGSAAQANCGGPSATHIVRVHKAGFFPTRTYVCYGDKLVFENHAGSDVRIYIEHNRDGDSYIDWNSGIFPNGASLATYGPNVMTVNTSNVDANYGARIMYNYKSGSNYTRYEGEIRIGTAPRQ